MTKLYLDDILKEYVEIAEKTGRSMYIKGEMADVLYRGAKPYVEERGFHIDYGLNFPENRRDWYIINTDAAEITLTKKYND